MSETNDEAVIERELGPFEGVTHVHGVSFDGAHVWACVGDALLAIDRETGAVTRRLEVPRARAGTAFDGRRLYQLAGDAILVVHPETGAIERRLPAPADGQSSGLAWAEGSLWLGRYHERLIHELDPRTGAIRRTLRSDRFVTGVTWTGGELWHGTSEAGVSELRRVDPETGDVRERLALPAGVMVSGLEADGRGRFFGGSGPTGTVRVIARGRARR